MSTRSVTIDGRAVSAADGQTILDVARENRIDVPPLCHYPGLAPTACCRVCLVQVAGTARLMPACATPVAEGMVVTTRTAEIDESRRLTVEMLLAQGVHVCAVCVANGNCELQALAAALGIDHLRSEQRWPAFPLDASHPRFVLDRNRCVLCLRCIRVCEDVEGARTLGLKERGADAYVITDMDRPWGESTTCTGCGKCVTVCATGALFTKYSLCGPAT